MGWWAGLLSVGVGVSEWVRVDVVARAHAWVCFRGKRRWIEEKERGGGGENGGGGVLCHR